MDRALTNDLAVNANFVYVRGYEQIGTVDYNPVLGARLGTSRRPNDLPCSAIPGAPCVNGGIPATSASVLQYTSFGETEYKGLTLSLNKRFSNNYQFLASYTLSKAEDNSTDFQSNFIPQNNGFGRDQGDELGSAAGLRARLGAGTGHARSAAPLRALGRLPVALGLRRLGYLHRRVGPSLHPARRGGSQRRRQRRRVPVRPRARESARRSLERRPQQRDDGQLRQHGPESEQEIPLREGRELRGHPGRVQSLQPRELLREHEPELVHDLRHGGVPREPAADLRPLHGDAAAAPGAAGGQDQFEVTESAGGHREDRVRGDTETQRHRDKWIGLSVSL